MVIQPKQILWPTDFSELSLHAAAYARAFHEHFGAELHVIHVIPPPLTPDVSVMISAEAPVAIADAEVLGASQAALDKIMSEQFAGVAGIRREAFYGTPWQGICDYAARESIDLIIVGTHGRTGLSHAVIGSTAERIVQHAPCPVLTVKSQQRGFLQP